MSHDQRERDDRWHHGHVQGYHNHWRKQEFIREVQVREVTEDRNWLICRCPKNDISQILELVAGLINIIIYKFQGIVFKCLNRQTGQMVAIKRYSESDADPVMRKIAVREVRMLRQLRHPNIINLIEIFRRRRRLHLVFDYCELTVLDVIEKYADRCPLKIMRRIIWQVVNGINYCHLKNVSSFMY